MTRIVFIGDEVTCAGFRLAGISTYSPAPDDLPGVFTSQKEQCDVVMITAQYAKQLPSRLLDGAVRSNRPLVAIVPDARDSEAVPDLENAAMRALGIEV